MYLAQTQTRKDSNCLRWGVILLSIVLMPGCALWTQNAKPETSALAAPQQDVQVVPIGSIDSSGLAPVPPELVSQLARVNVLLADYPLPGLQPMHWQYQWASADTLLQKGFFDTARRHLDALEAEIASHSHRYFKFHGTRYLEQARQYAFLSDMQNDRLRALEFAVETGAYGDAYHDGRKLVQELWSADKWVTAKTGDTLARISARKQVYDNYRLWPFLKAANPGYFYRSKAVQAGWRLRYPVHPRLDEIFSVLERQP